MHANAITALPVLAAIVGQAQAFNSHRHAHDQAEKRGVVWETVYETVYVTHHAQVQPAKTEFVANKAPVVTSTVVAQPPAPPAQAPPAEAPPAAPTTLVQAPKPKGNGLVDDLGLGDLFPGKTKTTPNKPASTGSLGFAKRGIAYNDANMANAFASTCNKNCGWTYNWGSSAPGLNTDAKFIPMLWGDLPVHTSHWDQDAEAAIQNGAKAFFSFNEPDMPSQSNMSPGAAAAAHAKYMGKYGDRVLIGSPSVTNSGSQNQGIDWLKQFMSACDATQGCQVDFCNVHWYSEAQYSETLFSHLDAARDACGDKPIWLTEFAPINSDSQVNNFMNDVIPRLEKLDYLDGYAYFMVADSKLMSSGSALSGIGNIYASITSLFS
jgi:hypothetical protein